MTGPLVRVVRSGVGRRRVQTVVIAVATMMAVAAAVVAGSLLVVSNAPFDHAFAQQKGAHLTAEFDPAKVTAEQLRATGRLDGVTASVGPYPARLVHGTDSAGRRPPAMTLVGRAGPHAAVDDLDLTAGRWVRKPGEVVLDSSYQGPAFSLGDTLTVADTTLTVVGFATSAGESADAWATPAQVTALDSEDAPLTSQMLYRFDSAGSKGDIAADRRELVTAVPAGGSSVPSPTSTPSSRPTREPPRPSRS